MIAGSVAAGIVSPVVNTGIFLLGLSFLFPSFLEAWATSAGQTVLTYMIFTMVSINFALELVINLVLSTVIVRVVARKMLRMTTAHSGVRPNRLDARFAFFQETSFIIGENFWIRACNFAS